ALPRGDTARRVLGAAGSANERFHITVPGTRAFMHVDYRPSPAGFARIYQTENEKWTAKPDSPATRLTRMYGPAVPINDVHFIVARTASIPRGRIERVEAGVFARGDIVDLHELHLISGYRTIGQHFGRECHRPPHDKWHRKEERPRANVLTDQGKQLLVGIDARATQFVDDIRFRRVQGSHRRLSHVFYM